MTRVKWALTAVLGLAFLVLIPAAGADQAHLVIEYEGARLHVQEDIGHTLFPLKTGPASRDRETRQWQAESIEVEGRVRRYMYVGPEDASPMQVFRNYEQALAAAGYEILFSGIGDELGSNFHTVAPHDQRIKVPPGVTALPIEPRNLHYLAATGTTEDGRAVYMSVLIHQIHSHRKVLEGTGTRTGIHLDIVESQEMATGLVSLDEVSSEEMLSAIVAKGRIALYGINFEFDRDAITPESAVTLAEVARLLREHQELKLLVVGHTDGKGAFDYNLNLSFRRAQAVVNELTGTHSIAAERLRAAGAGMMAPVSTNRTESGRTENRRVELVEF